MSGMDFGVATDFALCGLALGIIFLITHRNWGGEMDGISKKGNIDLLLKGLRASRQFAVKAGLEHHFIAEIDHLIATAEANREDEK